MRSVAATGGIDYTAQKNGGEPNPKACAWQLIEEVRCDYLNAYEYSIKKSGT